MYELECAWMVIEIHVLHNILLSLRNSILVRYEWNFKRYAIITYRLTEYSFIS